MQSTNKKVSSKKDTKRNLVKASTKYRILVAAIITFVVLVCGGYIINQTGVPARVLTGATIAGESVKVNELNYHFNEAYNMYYQYGIITSKEDLNKVFDEATGQTYRDYLYDVAAQNQQNIILLNREAKKEGFVSGYAARKVDEYITSLRDYAKTKKTTADNILKSQYGIGISVREIKSFMTREVTAQEYTEYLKQTKYTLTEEQMKAMYNAASADYDTVTFNAYLVAAAFDATATDAQKTTAVALAKTQAQTILDATKDAQSFRDASEKAAGTAGASQFADAADPTIYAKTAKTDVLSYLNTEVADYLYSADRKAGDMTVITTDAGAYAVYFQSRQLDTDASVNYRSILVSDTDIAAAKAKAEGYYKSVTDEASFITLAKKYSDESTTAIKGGLTSNVTAASINTTAPTEQGAALTAWLFSADRKPGDMKIIENVDGATLYYYQKTLPSWEDTLLTTYAGTEYKTWYEALAAAEGNGYTLNMGAIKFATY